MEDLVTVARVGTVPITVYITSGALVAGAISAKLPVETTAPNANYPMAILTSSLVPMAITSIQIAVLKHRHPTYIWNGDTDKRTNGLWKIMLRLPLTPLTTVAYMCDVTETLDRVYCRN